MPSPSRQAYFALRAFNVEIASIKDSSRLLAGRPRGDGDGGARSRFADNEAYEGGGRGSDASLATRLRMRWWGDAISGIYDGPSTKKNSSTNGGDHDDDGRYFDASTSARKHLNL